VELCIKSDAKNRQQHQKRLFSEANRDGTDAESPFPLFSFYLPHLRTLAQEKMSQNCLRFGNGEPSLCLYQLLSRNIMFPPSLTLSAAISVHYRDFENAYEFYCAALLAML